MAVDGESLGDLEEHIGVREGKLFGFAQQGDSAHQFTLSRDRLELVIADVEEANRFTYHIATGQLTRETTTISHDDMPDNEFGIRFDHWRTAEIDEPLKIAEKLKDMAAGLVAYARADGLSVRQFEQIARGLSTPNRALH